MCYHAQSLAEDGWRVAVIGYPGTPPPPPLRRSSVKHHSISRPGESFLNKLPRTGKLFALVAAPLKLLGQSASLFWILSGEVKPPPELIIVQTPPALPTLFVVRLVGLLLGSKVIFDWHNLSYSILAMRFPMSSPIVRLTKLLEKWTGKSAFAHLCVTRALKHHLEDSWNVKGPVKVLYDRPPTHFRRAAPSEAHRLLCNLAPRLSPSLGSWFPPYQSPNTSPFTDADGEMRSDRPALVVSSTSWTADEDFSMLLKAASLYEMRARELNYRESGGAINRPASPMLDSPITSSFDEEDTSFLSFRSGGSERDKSRRASVTSILPAAKRLPKMLLIVTGKGELRDHYIDEIARLEKEEAWEWVRIRTAWLQSEEYPVLLGSADVGVSLHSSSSGMDLPMKVVDMLGCDTPVCALGFPCIGELVEHGKNGLIFYNAQELASQLESLLGKHPNLNWLSKKMSTMDSLFPRLQSKPSIDLLRGQGQSNEPNSDSSRASSPPPSPLLARPPSPMPSFTLLASPMMGPHNDGSYHWSGNWKRVVRPLLEEADDAEEAKERMAKWEAAHTQSTWYSFLWRGKSRGWTRTLIRRSSSLKSALSTPRTSHEITRDEFNNIAGSSGISNRFDDDSILPRSSPRELRHRGPNRSQAWTGASQGALSGLSMMNAGIDNIPDIEISPADT
jgi:beta-1,4-mannosyltransferase